MAALASRKKIEEGDPKKTEAPALRENPFIITPLPVQLPKFSPEIRALPPIDYRRQQIYEITNDTVKYLEGRVGKIKCEPCVKPPFDAWTKNLPEGWKSISTRNVFYNGGKLLSEILKNDGGKNGVAFAYGDQLDAKLAPGDLIMKMELVSKNDPRIKQYRRAGDYPVLVDAGGNATPYIGTAVPEGSRIYLVTHYLTAGNENGGSATVIHSSVKKPLHKDDVPKYVEREKLGNHGKYGFLIISPAAFVVPEEAPTEKK